MSLPTAISNNSFSRSTLKMYFSQLVIVPSLACLLFPLIGDAGSARSSMHDGISLERISAPSGGYGYRLQYYVPAPIEVFWRFKTDFGSDILLTNDELIEHRLVESFDGGVITENRYASAPGLRFLWQTNVISDKFQLEFRLLNNEDCRHDFHFGSIQLTPAGTYTQVTQTAYFDFTGASLWVKYPWYGGMKSTLTKMVRWEQKVASNFTRNYIAAVKK